MNRNDFKDYMQNNVFTKRKVNSVKDIFRDPYLHGILLILLGLLCVFLPGFVSAYLGIIAGVLMMVFGVISLVLYFVGDRSGLFHQFEFVKSVFFIILGALMIRFPQTLMSFITVIIGVLFFLDSSVKVRGMLANPGKKTISWYVTFVLASVVAALGLFLIIFPLQGIATIMIFTGAIILARGCQKVADTWRQRHNF